MFQEAYHGADFDRDLGVVLERASKYRAGVYIARAARVGGLRKVSSSRQPGGRWALRIVYWWLVLRRNEFTGATPAGSRRPRELSKPGVVVSAIYYTATKRFSTWLRGGLATHLAGCPTQQSR